MSLVEVYVIAKFFIIKAIMHNRVAGVSVFRVLNIQPFPKDTEKMWEKTPKCRFSIEIWPVDSYKVRVKLSMLNHCYAEFIKEHNAPIHKALGLIVSELLAKL